jgi:hypothetical protein
MSSTVIVELNQNNASWQRPGEYECTLAQPISINEGDQLSFRMCSLDSNITDQDTILLTQAQTLTATFSYYEVNYNGADKLSVGQNGGLPVNPDYDYYAAYNDITTVTVTGIDLEIVGYEQGDPNPSAGNPIPGSYVVGYGSVGSAVDTEVNFGAFFTYVDPSGNVRTPEFTGSNTKFLKDPGFGDLYYTDNTNGTLTLQVTPFTMRSGTLQFAGVRGNWPGAKRDPYDKVTTFNFGSNVPRHSGNEAEYDSDFPYVVSDFTLGAVTYALDTASTGNVLDIRTVNVTLAAGRYDPQSLAVEITQLFSAAAGLKPAGSGDQLYVPNNPFLIRTDDPQNSNMFFNRVPELRVQGPIILQDGQTYEYRTAGTSVVPAYFVGATEFSLEYDVGGGQVFQLSYCHMPMSNPAEYGQQNIALYSTGSPGSLSFKTVTSASGIVFHDLQPASFWQDKLGLREKLIVPLLTDSLGLQYYTRSSLLRSITFGFQGLSTFILPATESGGSYPDFRKMSPLQPVADPLYLNVTGQSRAIIGDTITVNNSGGYFLIECLNAFRSTGGYIDTVENRRYISAIVSTQYDSNNSITGFGDSDIAGYVHRGASYLISSVVVRILDPLSKQPVSTLGPNNCIWLQVQKQPEVQSQTVTHPKRKPIIIRKVKPAEEPEEVKTQSK